MALNFVPDAARMGGAQAVPKKQHIVKTSAATLNKSKRKEKDFFFSFRFKTTSLRPVTSVA
jgi:hypothetical protein